MEKEGIRIPVIGVDLRGGFTTAVTGQADRELTRVSIA